MKTAISLPDDVFERAERLARRERRTRSALYAAALREYVARHEPDQVTEALNDVVGSIEPLDPFTQAAGTQILDNVEW